MNSPRQFYTLVVDDEPGIREMIAIMLGLHGHVVTTAFDGKMALALATAASFDLVITDVVMPEKDGLEFIRELRTKSPRTRIVAMSAGGHMAAMDYLKMAKHFGARAVLHKPFDKQMLLAAVATALAD